MRYRSTPITVATLLLCLAPLSASALTVLGPYSQDFELMNPVDTGALAADNWLVFGNVFSPDGSTFLYPYGPFPAPNDGSGFCGVEAGQGGVDQGANQLVAYNDYSNLTAHDAGQLVESNVYREWTIQASDVGKRWKFAFQAKRGNIELGSTAQAFIKTLDPNTGYALTNYIRVELTDIPTTWSGYALYLEIDASLPGQIFQIGFSNMATNYEGSGMYYDNILLEEDYVTDAPAAAIGLGLAQNKPNPFNPNTYIGFSLPNASDVSIDVYDLAGRHVASLADRNYPAGDHGVIWNGTTDAGVPVASGHYRYILRTAEGQVARGMTLLK